MIRSDFESLYDVRLPTYEPLPQVSEFSVFLLHLTLFSRFHAFSEKKRVSVEISIEEEMVLYLAASSGSFTHILEMRR